MNASFLANGRALPAVVLVVPLLQLATPTPTSTPQCAGVSLSVESVQVADYQFRLTIGNKSSAAVVLFNTSGLWWDLARKTTRGWTRAAAGGKWFRMPPSMEPQGKPPRRVEVEIGAGQAYTETFLSPDLWGDELTDHPGGLYRVTFALTPEPATEVFPPHCKLYAKPIVFQEASPAKRRERSHSSLPK